MFKMCKIIAEFFLGIFVKSILNWLKKQIKYKTCKVCKIIQFVILAYPAGSHILLKREKKSKICTATTRTTLHISQCVCENRWTDGCKQTRRMSKLLSPMHLVFRFLCSSILVLTLRQCRWPYALVRTRIHFLAFSASLVPSLWTASTFCISPIQLRQSHTSMR